MAGGSHVFLHEDGQTRAQFQVVGQSDVAPAGEVGWVEHGPSPCIDWAGDGYADSPHPLSGNSVASKQKRDRRGQCCYGLGRVVRQVGQVSVDDMAGQIDQNDGGLGRFQMDSHGIAAIGIQPDRRAGLPPAHRHRSLLLDQSTVNQLADHVGHRLAGQAGQVGHLHPTDLSGFSDGVENHTAVVIADGGKVGPLQEGGF